MHHNRFERPIPKKIAAHIASLVKMPPNTPVIARLYAPTISSAKTPHEACEPHRVCKDHCAYLQCGPHIILIETIYRETGRFSGCRECGKGSNKTSWFGTVIGTDEDEDVWKAIYGEHGWWLAPHNRPKIPFDIVALVQCDGPPVVPPYAARLDDKCPEWRAWNQITKKMTAEVYKHRALLDLHPGCSSCRY